MHSLNRDTQREELRSGHPVPYLDNISHGQNLSSTSGELEFVILWNSSLSYMSTKSTPLFLPPASSPYTIPPDSTRASSTEMFFFLASSFPRLLATHLLFSKTSWSWCLRWEGDFSAKKLAFVLVKKVAFLLKIDLSILSSGILSSWMKCYHLELILSSGTNFFHLEWNVIIWS